MRGNFSLTHALDLVHLGYPCNHSEFIGSCQGWPGDDEMYIDCSIASRAMRRARDGLAQCGARVACLDRRTDSGPSDSVELIEEAGGEALGIDAGVTDRSCLDDAVVQTEAHLGALGIAVYAAGIANANLAEEMGEEQFETLIDVNLKVVFFSCKAEARAMFRHQKGFIINIASMSGSIVNRGLSQAHYNASKASAIHMSKSMAMEWIGRGVRINSISPAPRQ